MYLDGFEMFRTFFGWPGFWNFHRYNLGNEIIREHSMDMEVTGLSLANAKLVNKSLMNKDLKQPLL